MEFEERPLGTPRPPRKRVNKAKLILNRMRHTRRGKLLAPLLFREQIPWLVGTVVAILVFLGLAEAWLLIGRVPDLFIAQAQKHYHTSLSLKEYLDAENAHRATMVQILSLVGTFLGGIAGIFGLRIALGQWQLAQRGHVTDRFTKAIDQLGSINLSTRLGAIYTLEQVARDSQENHWPIMEILTAFVREKAPWDGKTIEELPEGVVPQPRIDVQAVINVLSRRRWDWEEEHQKLDLSNCERLLCTLHIREVPLLT